jgi:hypothetical protein
LHPAENIREIIVRFLSGLPTSNCYPERVSRKRRNLHKSAGAIVRAFCFSDELKTDEPEINDFPRKTTNQPLTN